MTNAARDRVHTFRVGHFPMKSDNEKLREDLRWIRERRVTSGGFTEMPRAMEDMGSVFGEDEKLYRIFTDNHGGRPIEIPMIANRASTYKLDYKYFPISPGNPEVDFSVPRGISVLRYELRSKTHALKVAHIHTHWEAALQDRQTGKIKSNQRVEWTIENSIKLESLIKRFKEEGYAVFVTGDFNYRDYSWRERFRLWRYSPQKIFKRTSLKYLDQGFDYIAWDPKKVVELGINVVPRYSVGNHGDHPYFIGTFGWAA